MILVLFEDEKAAAFGPLTSTRPAFELRVGALNLRERLELAVPDRTLHVRVRPELQELLAWSFPDLGAMDRPPPERLLLVNARCGASVEVLRTIGEEVPAEDTAMRIGGDLAVAWITPGRDTTWDDVWVQACALPERPVPEGLRLYERPWDLIHANGRSLCLDFRTLADREGVARRIFGIRFAPDAKILPHLGALAFGAPELAIVYPGVHLLAPENIRFGPAARVKSGAVLDAEDGPILLGAGCVIQPNVTIQGPAYVGPGCVVNPGAKLREATSLGTLCKVGGEVEETVMLDVSNKQHDGFLGHAYLGSWVNLGADTNGSDLKNNYGNVRVDLGEGPIDSGQMFVGPTIADHAKTGINTMLTTGAVLGVAANVFGAGFPPRFIPSFGWGGDGGLEEYEIGKALATARRVLERRQALWTDAHARLLTHVFEATRSQR